MSKKLPHDFLKGMYAIRRGGAGGRRMSTDVLMETYYRFPTTDRKRLVSI